MKILVIGGTGFISSRLVAFLHDAGHDVSTLNRGRSASNRQTPVERLRADRHDIEAVRNVLGDRRYDVVYDMIAYTPDESLAMMQVLDGRADRYIHCSTISVYMISDQVTCPITEDQDKRPLMKYWPDNPFGMEYGIQKRRCEDVLWEAHETGRFQVSMLRPPYVCGPGDPVMRDWFWIERLLDGGPILIPGSGDFAFQNVYVDDVAAAFTALLDRPASIGRAYNVAAEEIFTLNEYLTRLGGLLDRVPELVHVPQKVFDQLPFSTHPRGDVFPFNTRRTALFSLDAIHRDLGYASTPFDAWMPKTIDWYRKEFGRASLGYDFRQEEISFARTWAEREHALHQTLSVD